MSQSLPVLVTACVLLLTADVNSKSDADATSTHLVGPSLTSQPPSRLDFANGTGAALECTATGNPPPSVVWTLLDGTPIANVSGLRQVTPASSSNSAARISFRPFRADQFRPDVHTIGYRCSASNSLGTVVSHDVHVKAVLAVEFDVHAYDEYAIRGNTAVLKCHVPSFLRDYVTVVAWIRDDSLKVVASADTDGKFWVSPQGELYIRNVDSSDKGSRYHCQTTNRLTGQSRTSSTASRLMVTEPKGIIPPKIVEGVSSVAVKSRETAFLPCVAQGFPTPSTAWLRKAEPGELTTLVSSKRVKPISQGLLVADVGGSDDGIYVCQVNTSTWTTTHEVRLQVIDPLEVRLEPARQTLNVGQPLSLRCEVLGKVLGKSMPHVSVAWLKDGHEVTKSAVEVEHVGPMSSRLHIASMRSEDKGMYQCFAKSGDSIVQAAALVALGDFHPEFVKTFEAAAPKDPGSDIRLSCSAVGNPEPSIEWSLDGVAIDVSNRHFVLTNEFDGNGVKRSTIHARKSRVEDGGLYACEAVNRIGKARHAGRVNIYGTLRARSVPELTAVAGENTMLSCPVYGYPIDEIEWLKDSQILPTSVRQKVFPNGTLFVESVLRDQDGGKYVCVATNKKGETVEATVRVSVMVAPKILPFAFQDDLLREGMRARLQCVISEGDSPVRIVWLKDGVPLPMILDHADDGTDRSSFGGAGDILIQNVDEFSSILALKTVTPRHNGVYTCAASNAAGSTTHSALLSVNDDQNFKGMRAHITCAVSQGDLPIAFVWLKDSHPLNTEFGGVKVAAYDPYSSSLSLESVGAEHSGNYTCVARNVAGEARHTAQLLVQVRPVILPFAFQDESFSVGGNIAVVCMLTEGDPPLTFSWTKDEMLVPSTAAAATSIYVAAPNDFSSMLTVRNATPAHGGNYTCTVRNLAATAQFTARLRVNVAPKIVPFSFGDRYFAGVLVRISCVVYQGDLPLEIRWLKDGRQIRTNDLTGVGGISVQTVDDFTSVLTIDNIESANHSGNYTCVAKNAAAAASHSSQLVINVPPKIVPFTFQEEQLAAGMFVRVSCVVSRGDLPLDIDWLKDGHLLPSNLNVSTRTFDEYSSVLSIDSLSYLHNGNYTCVASNEAAAATFTAPLVVNVPPRWIKKPDYKVTAVVSQDVFLHCQAEGFPKPTITWSKDTDGALLGDDHLVFENGTLKISSVREDQEGYYVCKATNGIGVGLDVIVHVRVFDPPAIVFRSENQTVEVGRSVSFSCVAKGDTPMNVSWSIDGKILGTKLPNRFVIKEDQAPGGLSSELTVAKVSKNDNVMYACVAQNAYGQDESTMKLIVQSQPDPPMGVSVTDVGNQAVKVSWKTPFDGNAGPPLTYIIEYRQKGGIALNKTVHGGQQITTISGLQPSATYFFRMFAENSFGRSNPTDLTEVILAGEVPSGSPKNVEVQTLDSQTIKVSWQPPPRDSWNGDIRGYFVGYREASSTDAYEFQMLEVPTGYDRGLSFTIPELREFTKYAIVIQAFNDIGRGPLSDEILVMTSEDVPSMPPVDVSCLAQSSNKIVVKWKSPAADSVNGILRGYRVLNWPADSWDGRHIGMENATGNVATLSQLSPFTNYSIQVVAYTFAGDGIPSRPVYCRTWEDVPGSLANVKCVPGSAESVVVFWMPPQQVNGQIIHYTVYVEDPSNGWQAKHKVVGKSSYHEVQGLKRSLRYKFWVTASSVLGEGKQSQMVYCGPAASFVLAKCVTFNQTFKLTQGAKLILPCPAVGVPAPQFTWLHGNQEVVVEDKRLQVLADKSLMIDSVNSADAGNYTCQVINDYGGDQTVHTVVVQVPPAAPILSVTMATFNSIGLRWKPRANGDSPIHGFILKYKPESSPWESVELQPYHDSHTLRNLRCGTAYEMSIIAVNEVGRGENSDVLTVSTDGGVPLAPPSAQLIEESTTHCTLHLDSWVTNGCPILYFTVEYKSRRRRDHGVGVGGWTLVTKGVRPNQRMLVVADLIPDAWYALRMTAHSTAGTTVAEYDFATLALDHAVKDTGSIENDLKETITGTMSHVDLKAFTPIVACAIVILLCAIGTCVWVRRKRSQQDVKAAKVRGDAKQDGQSNAANRSTLTSLRRSGGQQDGADSDDDISPYAMVRLSDFQPGTAKSTGHSSGPARHSVPAWQHTPPPGMFVHHQPTAPPMSESYGAAAGMGYPPGAMMTAPSKSGGGGVPQILGYAQPLKGNKSKSGAAAATSGTHPPRSHPHGSSGPSEATFVFPAAPPDGDYDPPPEFKWILWARSNH